MLALQGENDALRAEVASLKTLIFGARSERAAVICAEQLAFGVGGEDSVAPTAANDDDMASRPAKKKRAKAQRNIGALPAHLPRCEQVIEPCSTLCPCCATQMRRIGEDVAEALDRAPAQLRVVRTIRPKYACRACEGPIVQAKAPARLVEGGMATTALIAYIAAAKYAWQSTLYRQSQIFAGWGLVIDRQTLSRWMKSAASVAKGLYELQLKTMHGYERLFCDESVLQSHGRGSL
ncbi:MAG: IS66 family transposase zinc-finger binding domain-containing protein [Methylocystis sp.]